MWNLHEQTGKSLKMARNSAQLTFENDVLYRRWGASQGGVYVRASEQTPPNPYLQVPDRDVTTTSGQSLTLVNPAYMARLVHELPGQEGGTRGHITSLRPLRPENKPDEWETAALLVFEKGITEVSSVEKMGDGEYLRLMRPFVTEKACLKCHAAQGYQEGDIRGGISVSVPMAPLRAFEKPMTGNLEMAHAALWMAGLAGIAVSKRGLGKQMMARERAEEDLRASEELARQRLAAIEDLYLGAPVGLCELDCGLRYVHINERLAQMHGYPAAQHLGRTVREMVPGLADAIDPVFRSILETGEPVLGYEVQGETAAQPGVCRTWIESLLPLRNSTGEVSGISIVAEEITERKQAEEQIRRNVEELRVGNEELTRLSQAMVGRELRMVELKAEVNELCSRAGQPQRYPLDFEKEQP
jgi:PAS domain S-box-containing protein